MSWKTKYCEALALVPYAIDKDVNEVNLCEETLCKDCVFQSFAHCDAVNRANYYEEHFDEIFSKKVNRTRPAVGFTEDGYVGGCSDIDCYECIFRFSGECSIMAEEFVWEKIDEENRESTDMKINWLQRNWQYALKRADI